MKIMHLSTHDVSGGAAIAAYRLNKSLNDIGYNSSMFVLNRKLASDQQIQQFEGKRHNTFVRASNKLRSLTLKVSNYRYQRIRPHGFEKFTDDRVGYARDLIAEFPKVDVINVHWVADFVQVSEFIRAFGGRVPLVFTLHDMNLFTGGCHYALDCLKFKTRCDRCPQLGSRRKRDLAYKGFERKRRSLKQWNRDSIRIVCPSQWLAKLASDSALLRDMRIDVIANCSNLHVFYRRDRIMARQILEIPQKAKVILFVSEATSNKRKGLDLLLSALRELECSENLVLLTVGSGVPERIPTLPHIHLGSIFPENLMANIYSAADLFVAPYIQDNLPNTIIESMACKTPVVAYSSGGVSEIIDDEVNGILVSKIDSGSLKNALDRLLSDEREVARLAAACRTAVERKFDRLQQAQKYAQMYQSMLLSA